jgi:hypothetical protein
VKFSHHFSLKRTDVTSQWFLANKKNLLDIPSKARGSQCAASTCVHIKVMKGPLQGRASALQRMLDLAQCICAAEQSILWPCSTMQRVITCHWHGTPDNFTMEKEFKALNAAIGIIARLSLPF